MNRRDLFKAGGALIVSPAPPAPLTVNMRGRVGGTRVGDAISRGHRFKRMPDGTWRAEGCLGDLVITGTVSV